MLEVKQEDISVEELMAKIRAEIERGRSEGRQRGSRYESSPMPSFKRFADRSSQAAVPESQLPHYPPPPRIEKKDRYTLQEILNYSDTSFIEAAYCAALRRGPDQEGYAYYLDQLRSGQSTKLNILRNLRYSPEGKEKAVPIDGLFWPALAVRLYRVPILGYVASLAIGTLRLPRLNRGVQTLMASMEARFAEQAAMSNRLAEVIENRLAENEKRLERVAQDAVELSQAIGKLDSVFSQRIGGLARDAVEQSEAIGKLEGALSQRIEGLQRDTAEQSAVIGEFQQDLVRQVGNLDYEKADVEALIGVRRQVQKLMKLKAEQGKRLSELENANANDKQAFQGRLAGVKREYIDYKYNAAEQQRQLKSLIDEARASLPVSLPVEQAERLVEEDRHIFDAFYAAFEDRFRGTRDVVKRRQAVYLSYIASAGAGKDDAPIVDIGCGRGEWLELLSENGYRASGLDLNRVMVRRCQELDLDAREADAIEYLKQQKSNSLGAVTGFHVIEHVSFYALATLFNETLRTLKPGGVAIFETPNPENLMVGAYLFYTDMDHRRPLVPDSVKFLAEQSGFDHIAIKRLHDRREWMEPATDEFRRRWFYSEQDYALIAYKCQ
jgi:SAM-dependent methyltransferase